jgi:hypothetical protein
MSLSLSAIIRVGGVGSRSPAAPGEAAGTGVAVDGADDPGTAAVSATRSSMVPETGVGVSTRSGGLGETIRDGGLGESMRSGLAHGNGIEEPLRSGLGPGYGRGQSIFPALGGGLKTLPLPLSMGVAA